MRPYELPLISEDSSVEEQLRQIKSYLYRQAENLNYNLKNSDVTSIWKQTSEALSVSGNDEVEQMRRDEFQALRGLIVKSATSIIKNEDSFAAHFAGDYRAESDYGTFTEEGNIHINGNPYTIGQIYKYRAEILTDVQKYKTDLEGFIKTGVLERETSSPVFGMEIGYNKSTYTVGDEVYVNNAPAKIRLTPVKIGLYQGDYEVAYLQNSAIYFPAAHSTGGSIAIGKNFSVDNQGNMIASNAKLTGALHAKSGYIGGFEIRSSSDMPGKFWPCSLSSVLTPTDGKENDDYQYVVFMRGNYNDDGTDYGAVDTTNTVFGIKKRAKAVMTWDNEVSPYVYNVNVKGDVFCQAITCSSIAPATNYETDLGSNNRRWRYFFSEYLYVGSENLIIGTLGQDTYTKPIYLRTTANVYFGQDSMPINEVHLCGKTIYIGKKNSNLTTDTIKLEAKTIIFTDEANSYKFSTIMTAIKNLQAKVG